MGMYDTINGEQVKCFPWVSLYKDEITYHGGDLKYYGIGDEVPCKKPHYNYGKNFIILDLNRYPESDYCEYDYIIHVIIDGRVNDTFENKIGSIDWSINENVVDYFGELLDIHSNEDITNYIAAQRKYWIDRENIRSHWNELFKESMNYFTGIGLLDKDSEEKKMRLTKIEEIHKLMDEEEKRIKPEIDKLNKEHSRWFVDTSDIDDLIHLGEYISAYSIRDNDKEQCMEMIQKLLNSDSSSYDRYIKWQGSDEYIKEFKKR